MKIPPYLKKGNSIGITCPAGYMAYEKAATCIATLQKWGFDVMVGKTLGSASSNYFSGTDEDRRDELQAMLDDATIHCILFGRGGYGMGRIIDDLDFTKFKRNPKWLIGFSDITLLHSHLHEKIKVSSIHGPMAAAFNNGEDAYIKSLKAAMLGKKTNYSAPAQEYNKLGKASGSLIGGNLSLIAHSIGTASQYKTKNKILFIEDIGELIYAADRMLHQLKRSGLLKGLAGLIVGGFSDMKDTDRPFGKNIFTVMSELTAEYDYPVCYQFPISHDTENVAVKIGLEYELTVSKKTVKLREL